MQNRNDGIRRYDVGVDANEFRPVSVKEIIAYFDIWQEMITNGMDTTILHLKEKILSFDKVCRKNVKNIWEPYQRGKIFFGEVLQKLI